MKGAELLKNLVALYVDAVDRGLDETADLYDRSIVKLIRELENDSSSEPPAGL
jgi:hypothetical protein